MALPMAEGTTLAAGETTAFSSFAADFTKSAVVHVTVLELSETVDVGVGKLAPSWRGEIEECTMAGDRPAVVNICLDRADSVW